MIKMKKPRNCKNCELYEDGRCFLNFPTVSEETFPYLAKPVGKCYKVTTVKDYMTIIRNIEIYQYTGLEDV